MLRNQVLAPSQNPLGDLLCILISLTLRRLSIVDADLVRDEAAFFQSVEVGFQDVGMILKRKNQADRVILDGSLCGAAKPGRMLAIMGPSGR